MEEQKINSSNRFVIIMAGGRGERFWPVSRQATPKQLITLLGNRSFLQQTVDRLDGLIPPENIFVITNKVQARAVEKQLPQLPQSNIVAEPCGRDTCAAVALGAALVGQKNREGVMAVLPADHVIPNAAQFQQVLGDAFAVAAAEPKIVTIGIKPTEPATGYGYIKTGADLVNPGALADLKTRFFEAEKFVEKPAFETAVEYLNSGSYRWNAGMFIWSYATIMNALKAFQPDLWMATQRLELASDPSKLKRLLAREYPMLKKISVDYAIMEKAANVVVADGSFEWDDLGAWPALARHLPRDEKGNCAVGNLVQVDSENNIVFDGRTKNKTPLVASRNQSQQIKELVAKLAAIPEMAHLI
jgi:mannose-1-phosphate guanylyltransferase